MAPCGMTPRPDVAFTVTLAAVAVVAAGVAGAAVAGSALAASAATVAATVSPAAVFASGGNARPRQRRRGLLVLIIGTPRSLEALFGEALFVEALCSRYDRHLGRRPGWSYPPARR